MEYSRFPNNRASQSREMLIIVSLIKDSKDDCDVAKLECNHSVVKSVYRECSQDCNDVQSSKNELFGIAMFV